MTLRQITRCSALIAPLALAPALLHAQASSPIADVQHSYASLKANILKAADSTPESAYSFRPTPEVRTFARVVNHISEAQLHSCGALNHASPESLPKVPAETAGKAAVVSALRASFAECDKAYESLNESNLLGTVPSGANSRARITLAWGNVSHDNEQYAALALYMRLKGITPPSAEK